MRAYCTQTNLDLVSFYHIYVYRVPDNLDRTKISESMTKKWVISFRLNIYWRLSVTESVARIKIHLTQIKLHNHKMYETEAEI